MLHSVAPLYVTCVPVRSPVAFQRVKPPAATRSVAQLRPSGVRGGVEMTIPSWYSHWLRPTLALLPMKNRSPVISVCGTNHITSPEAKFSSTGTPSPHSYGLSLTPMKLYVPHMADALSELQLVSHPITCTIPVSLTLSHPSGGDAPMRAPADAARLAASAPKSALRRVRMSYLSLSCITMR